MKLVPKQHFKATFQLTFKYRAYEAGVKDILIACIDNLQGFVEAIESIFSKTEVQLCVVHQIRNRSKYVTSRGKKAFIQDLKKVYQAVRKESAEEQLDGLEEK